MLRIRTLGLNEAAEYLEMAARLLRIKAQMLLPRGDEESVGRSARRARAAPARVSTDARGRRRARAARRGAAQPVRARLSAAGAGAAAGAARALARRAAVRRRSRAARGEAAEHARSHPARHRHSRRDHDHSLRARAAGAHPVDGDRRTHAPSPGRFSRRCSGCSSSRSSASCASLSRRPFANVEITRDAASEAA